MPTEQEFYAHGKLLICGEYVVLDGVKSLAFPTVFGQKLSVKNNTCSSHFVEWKAFNLLGKKWMDVRLDRHFHICNFSADEEAFMLQKIFRECVVLNPTFLQTSASWSVETHIDFNRNWGLGSSSTLISCMARWANVSPYLLLEKTFGGSGYDIACATANAPILYALVKSAPKVIEVKPGWSFTDSLFFVYLGKKMSSRKAISTYTKIPSASKNLNFFESKTEEILGAKSLEDWEFHIDEWEKNMSVLLALPTVKELYFDDKKIAAKSLGAWGGDFCMISWKESKDELSLYLKEKGFNTFFAFNEIILPY